MAKTLVLYYSATNTTKNIAEQVAQKLNADIAEIHAAQPYTAADLNWHDSKSRTSIEQHQHDSRVAVMTFLTFKTMIILSSVIQSGGRFRHG